MELAGCSFGFSLLTPVFHISQQVRLFDFAYSSWLTPRRDHLPRR